MIERQIGCNVFTRLQLVYVTINGSPVSHTDKAEIASFSLFLLSFDEDVLVFGLQYTFTDELLSNGDGDIVGHTQV